MRRCRWLIPLILLVGGLVEADSLYELDLTRDLILGGASIGVFGTSLFLQSEPGNATPADDINGLDSRFMFPYRQSLDSIGTMGACVSLLVSSIAVAGQIHEPNGIITYGVMYSEAFLLTIGTKDVLKALIVRHRPYTYLGPVPDGEDNDYFNSFPSGHTAFAFLGATFLATTYCTDHPQSRWRIPLVVMGYSIAAATGAMRVVSGNHFATDVIAGALMGSFYGWLVPQLHLLRERGDSRIGFLPTEDGICVSISM